MIRKLLPGPLKGFPDLPPIWLLAALVTVWVLHRGLPLLVLFGPVWRGVGFFGVAAGFGLIGWSAWWFWRKRTTIEPLHTPSALIVEGPYRLSRNPIYLGMAVILGAAIAAFGSLSPVIVLPAFVWVITQRFIAPEEALLRDLFGAEAHAYLASTRRWL